MTITLRMPTGTSYALTDLNVHDLQQYYCYQMDILTQAEDVLSSLGIAGWNDGTRPGARMVVEPKTKPADAFLVAPAAGNRLPTYYDTTEWQGMVVEDKGLMDYPAVNNMDLAQLQLEIIRQQELLSHFVESTSALTVFAHNVQAATQPPQVDGP